LLLSDAGTYSCVAGNNCGSTTTGTVLTMGSGPSLPDTVINLTKNAGDSLAISVSPLGTEPFIYQWLKNYTDITGATDDIFKIKNLNLNDAGTYSCEVSNICGSTTAMVATIDFNDSNGNVISGKVIYDNKAKTPMKNTNLFLETMKGEKLDSTVTDQTGAFKFIKVANGTYKLVCGKTIMKWGGSNPVDALTVNKYYVGLIMTFGDELRKTAADVKNDGNVNPIDALMINRRFLNFIKHYVISDWLYESLSVTVNDASISQDIKAISAGDVNGSYPR
jgi:hypothetical protein